MDEAHYLLAILNSPGLGEILAPYPIAGSIGARHFDKYVWYPPIPEFDASVSTHIDLAALGKRAAEVARERDSSTWYSISAGARRRSSGTERGGRVRKPANSSGSDSRVFVSLGDVGRDSMHGTRFEKTTAMAANCTRRNQSFPSSFPSSCKACLADSSWSAISAPCPLPLPRFVGADAAHSFLQVLLSVRYSGLRHPDV